MGDARVVALEVFFLSSHSQDFTPLDLSEYILTFLSIQGFDVAASGSTFHIGLNRSLSVANLQDFLFYSAVVTPHR